MVLRVCLTGVLLFFGGPWGGPVSSGQTPPAYSDLFQDAPRTDRLTPADLPNLGRLVVLEATSMFVHVRSELADSPASYRLLDQIRTLWNAADAFTAAVAYYPLESQRIEAGRLALPDLEAAFENVRSTFGVLPGGAWSAAGNLLNMSRVMAVLGPLLREAETALPAAPEARPIGEEELVQSQAERIRGAITALRTGIAGQTAASEVTRAIDRQLETLAQLVQGLQRVVDGEADERELVSSLRPLRALAQRIDLGIQAGRLGILTEWRPIQRQIDDLADRFQLPREIVVRSVRKDAPELDPALAARLEEAARGLDALLAQTSAELPQLAERGQIEADAKRLQRRLILLRQSILGGESSPLLDRALLDVESARRQLKDRSVRAPGPLRDALAKVIQSVDAAIALARTQLQKAR
jgi:hypothetical protein